MGFHYRIPLVFSGDFSEINDNDLVVKIPHEGMAI